MVDHRKKKKSNRDREEEPVPDKHENKSTKMSIN